MLLPSSQLLGLRLKGHRFNSLGSYCVPEEDFGSLSLYFCQLCKVDLFLQAWFHLMVFITKRCRLLESRARYFMSVTSHHLECHLHRYFHTVKLIAVA